MLARKRVEESEKRFQQLANSLPDIIWTATPNGVVDYFNDRWYEFINSERKDLAEGSWDLVLHPDDVKVRDEHFYKSMRTGEPYRVEYRFKDLVTQDYRWFLGRALPVKDSDGNITKWFGSTTDINETKLAEEKLANAVVARDNFMAVASHELNTPLTSLKLQMQMNKRTLERKSIQAFSADVIKKLLDTTLFQTERLARLCKRYA